MRSALRAFGLAAAVAWIALGLDRRADWPLAGFVALALSLSIVLVAARLSPRSLELLPRAVLALPGPIFVGSCAAVAAGLSAWAVHHAMRDEPLSIDAGLYVLQARAMLHGHFGAGAPHPIQAFGDRFLLEGPDHKLYGIFPPGWPLALAPFVAMGAPMFAGPAVAVALVYALVALGRSLGRAAGDADAGELASRVAVLLSLASIGRALETADLLSHAFVATLAAFALAGAIDLGMGRRAGPDARAERWKSVAVGACVGWVGAARLLDGVVLGVVVLVVIAARGRSWWAACGLALGAAPFALFLVVEQHAVTGSWWLPTQTLYFARSDWPPTCHRLGFGPDVGCTVEHPGPVSRLGGDGYDLHDALRITRERAQSLGEDLLGWAPLLLVGFAPLVVFHSAIDGVLVVFLMAFTLAYALFYYGNALFFGARHLFPTAAFVWLAVGRGASLAKRPSVRGAAIGCVLVIAVAGVWRPWAKRTSDAAAFQSHRSDLRRTIAVRAVPNGIVRTSDLTSFATAFDPGSEDGRDDAHVVALDDGAGLLELRRVHPDMPIFLSLPDDEVGRLYAGRPAPGVNVELERSWPTFVRPHGLAVRQSAQDGASGKTVLLLSHASVGASVEIVFETAVAGTYALHVDATSGPEEGDYSLELDGEPLPTLHGYAGSRESLRGPTSTRALDACRHVMVARCIGRDPRSDGYDARLDAVAGVPVAEP